MNFPTSDPSIGGHKRQSAVATWRSHLALPLATPEEISPRPAHLIQEQGILEHLLQSKKGAHIPGWGQFSCENDFVAAIGIIAIAGAIENDACKANHLTPCESIIVRTLRTELCRTLQDGCDTPKEQQ